MAANCSLSVRLAVKKTSATLVVSVAVDCDFLDLLISFFVGKLSFVAHNSDMRLKDVRMSQRSCYAATELFS